MNLPNYCAFFLAVLHVLSYESTCITIYIIIISKLYYLQKGKRAGKMALVTQT